MAPWMMHGVDSILMIVAVVLIWAGAMGLIIKTLKGDD